MATSLSTLTDPLQLLRELVDKLEGGLNTLATGGIRSQRGGRTLRRAATVAMGLQRVLDALSDDLLRRANLPSRKQVDELAETLRRIEDKLDRLQPADAFAAPVPRPPRTRRPAVAEPAPAPARAAPRRAPRRKEG